MPSKKERAKQRKAAKKSRQATNTNNINSLLRDDVPEHFQAWPDSYTIEIAKLVETGNYTATLAMAESLGPT